ncbi:Uncharacterised protein [Hafnia alvei]|nr:Uncharacterised protein [Hafnia alvei]
MESLSYQLSVIFLVKLSYILVVNLLPLFKEGTYGMI